MLQENKEFNSHRLTQKSLVLPQNWEKKWKFFDFRAFFANFIVQ